MRAGGELGGARLCSAVDTERGFGFVVVGVRAGGDMLDKKKKKKKRGSQGGRA